jgi:hypothetical protein
MRLLTRWGIWRMAGNGTADIYRVNAEKCLELAHTCKDLESKRMLLGMPNAWLTLVEQKLKNSKTARRPPRVKASDDLK